jgi:hypothetical protein
MMDRRPPTLADWLLDRLGYTRQNAALAGDLLEEYREGRSAGWYWRQTIGVIAHAIPRHASALAPYMLALIAGYALQLPLSYALWALRLPPVAPASGWARFGLYLSLQATAVIIVLGPEKWILGKWVVHLRPQYYAATGDPQKRSTVLALAGYESFCMGLLSYCLCAVVFWRFSQAEFLKYQSIWFLWVVAPAAFSTLAAPAVNRAPAPGPVEDRERCCYGNLRCAPVVTVVLPNDRTILLDRDRLAESIFAAADPQLIRTAFGHGQSLDLLRRAVWLGGHRSREWITGRSGTLTLTELAALIRQTARTPQVEAALFDTYRRPSVWDRLNRAFRGDPV